MAKSKSKSKSENANREELMARAEALVPAIRARVDETERLRRLPEDTVAELRAAGLNRVLQPAAHGGAEAPFAGLVDVVSTIAGACASTGWVLAQYTIHNYMVAQFPAEGQQDMWGDKPAAFVCGVLIPGCGKAEPVDGGWRLSGRWPFASGVMSADWCILSAFGQNDARESLMFLVPRDSLTVHDTWHTIGLCGTGSNDVSVEDLFIPAHRTMTVDESKYGEAPGTKVNTGPLYRLGTFSMFSVVQSSTAYGLARGALDNFLARTRQRTGRVSGQRVIDYGTTQVKIGEAAVALDTARVMLYACADEAMAVAAAGGVMNIEDKSRMRGDATFAGNLAARAVDIMFSLAGGAGLYDGHPISRTLRDMKCAQSHMTQNWDINGSNYGRVLLGLPTLDDSV
jgi:3-hydroxy-9,10-secoandrosta-1,3,5(10)-triene-9,17-dione monooxygenase